MKKIAQILETCNDCIHCENFVSETSNHTSVAVCTNEKNLINFLLVHSEVDKNVKNRSHIEIPKNCPLEDYKS